MPPRLKSFAESWSLREKAWQVCKIQWQSRGQCLSTFNVSSLYCTGSELMYHLWKLNARVKIRHNKPHKIYLLTCSHDAPVLVSEDESESGGMSFSMPLSLDMIEWRGMSDGSRSVGDSPRSKSSCSWLMENEPSRTHFDSSRPVNVGLYRRGHFHRDVQQEYQILLKLRSYSQMSKSSVHRWKLISGLGRAQSQRGPLNNGSAVHTYRKRWRRRHSKQSTPHPLHTHTHTTSATLNTLVHPHPAAREQVHLMRW